MQKLVSKDTAELEPDDPKKGVVVLSDHAIVVTSKSILFFNLKDYFIKSNDIDDQETLETLGTIMDFMHGHMFSPAFWEELTKGAIVSVEDETLQLDGAVRKDLIYSEKMFDPTEIKTILEHNVDGEPKAVSRSAFFINPLYDILKVMNSFVKNDSIALEYIGVNTMIRFTFEGNPWMFGLISSDPMLNSKHFLFGEMAFLYNEIK